MGLDSWYWHFLEKYVYALPPLKPRVRTKPMEVLCLGLPRSGTESLQNALLHLGYDHTYHGWDILFDEPIPAPGFVRLARKKWYGGPDGEAHITREEFDELIGHAVALTDAPGNVFAAEMIRAYPEAKVVLNVRRDLDAWHHSAVTNLVGINESTRWWSSWFCKEYFWGWHAYERFLWTRLFRCPDENLGSGVTVNGKWIYRGES